MRVNQRNLETHLTRLCQGPDSKIFKDAVKLQKFTQSKVQELCDDDAIHYLLC